MLHLPGCAARRLLYVRALSHLQSKQNGLATRRSFVESVQVGLNQCLSIRTFAIQGDSVERVVQCNYDPLVD